MPPLFFTFADSCAYSPQIVALAFPERAGGVYTPGILYEYQNKGITRFAIRNRLILKGLDCGA